MKNKINNATISNKRVYTYIAIIFIVIFIIGIIALGVFRFGNRGGDTPSKTYYTYVVNNSNLTSESKKDDEYTFTLNTNIKYHESMVFKATNDASIGAYGHSDDYLFAGIGITFTLFIEDETYFLDSAITDGIRVKNTHEIDEPTYLLPENTYTKEYNSESKSYKVTLNNTEVRYIHSIELKYAVGKK